MNEKKLCLDELESVSGGTRKQTDEIVALYNKYNPDSPSGGYSPEVLKWICDLMGYRYDSFEHPVIHNRPYSNSYEIPDRGVMDHRQFMKLLNEKITERYG